MNSNPLLVPDLTAAIRESQEIHPDDATEAVTEDVAGEDEAPEETEEEAAAAEKFKRIPNRRMTRDMINQRGEEQALRSRVRRGIYRQRRKHDAR